MLIFSDSIQISMNVKSTLIILISLISFSSMSQQLERFLLENWSNGAWENRMQQLPTYDDEGRLASREIAHWDAILKVWEDQTKTVFNRDEKGSLLTREIFNWMPDQSIWQATLRSSFTNNAKNKPSSVLNEALNEQGWYNKSIDEYKYDANGKMIQRINERWDKHLTAWVPYSKFDYTIESNRTAGYTTYFWDTQLAKWDAYKKASYFYTASGNIDHILYETQVDGSWKNYSVRKNSCDDKGVLNTMEVDNFDPTSETWNKTSHVDYLMTDFNKLSESLSKKWNNEMSDWENLQRFTYSYSEDGETINEWSEENNEMEIFPNPVKESLTIRSLPIGAITILDAIGKVVFQVENDKDQIHLDVSKWEIGVYSVQANGNEIQKFVKQ